MNRNNYKTFSQQCSGWMFYLVMSIAVMFLLTGCGTAPVDPALAGRIEVQATKVERVYITVPESQMAGCTKPKTIRQMIPELDSGKVSVQRILTALAFSQSNAINCWLVKEETIKLQRALKIVQEAGK
jgi:hypothetical protein